MRPLIVSYGKIDNSLMTTADDQNLRLGLLEGNVDSALSAPRVGSNHVPVTIVKLWELVKRLDSRVQCPDLDAGGGVD
jgi:hypothetical protein